nr:MAG TPA: Protein of unknown function (DUF1549) [Caudoviricetes sp.]
MCHNHPNSIPMFVSDFGQTMAFFRGVCHTRKYT